MAHEAGSPHFKSPSPTLERDGFRRSRKGIPKGAEI